jgi:hypothetical protein
VCCVVCERARESESEMFRGAGVEAGGGHGGCTKTTRAPCSSSLSHTQPSTVAHQSISDHPPTGHGPSNTAGRRPRRTKPQLAPPSLPARPPPESIDHTPRLRLILKTTRGHGQAQTPNQQQQAPRGGGDRGARAAAVRRPPLPPSPPSPPSLPPGPRGHLSLSSHSLGTCTLSQDGLHPPGHDGGPDPDAAVQLAVVR